MDKFSELKAAAMAATPGPWNRTITRFNGITNSTHSMASFSSEGVLANANEKRDAIFIATANPAAVLELLAELEEKDQQLKMSIRRESAARKGFDEQHQRAESAEKNMELHFNAIEAERGLYGLERKVFRNHIAELEKKLATPVRLPVVLMGYQSDEYRAGFMDGVERSAEEVRGAGFKVEGG